MGYLTYNAKEDGKDHCSFWGGIPQDKQTIFTRTAVAILTCAFRTGVYNLPINWNRVNWRYGTGVQFPIRCSGWASYDFDQLTRLVVAGHEECIRIEIAPRSFKYLSINMWRRHVREGAMMERHPTIEQAVEEYRSSQSPPIKTHGEEL